MKEQSKIQNPKSKIPKVCLTIAGLDPSGGAGIIADIETFTAFGCYATCAITSLTFQNTTGVFGAVHQTAATVRGQIEPILQDFEIAALKTGMLPTREIIEATAHIIRENNLNNLVVDPVVRSTSGYDLIDDEALRVLIKELFPLSAIVTPNLPEAERIARMQIKNEADIKQAAQIMQSFGAENVLIKGGHLLEGKRRKVKGKKENDNQKIMARDFLFSGNELLIFEAEYIETTATHGTGCTLSAAIAANLALSENLLKSVEIAKQFVTEAIRTAPFLGNGHSSVNHLLKNFG